MMEMTNAVLANLLLTQQVTPIGGIAPDGSWRLPEFDLDIRRRGRLTPKQIEWCKANIPAFEDLLK